MEVHYESNCDVVRGSSYAAPSLEDVEHFGSLQEAKEDFEERYDNLNSRTPCVDETAETWISWGVHDFIEYPDMIIKFGPRGGIITERV